MLSGGRAAVSGGLDFARAARRYLDELAARSLAEQVNAVLRAAGSDDSAAAAAAAAGCGWQAGTSGDPAGQYLLGRSRRAARSQTCQAPPGPGHPGRFNASRLGTTLAAVITSGTGVAAMPGNVFLPAAFSGLPKDAVVNVTALVTVDETEPDAEAGHLPPAVMSAVDRGPRRILGSSQNVADRGTRLPR